TASMGVIALVNLGLAAVVVFAATATSRSSRPATCAMAVVVAGGILVNLLSPATTRFVDPSVARIHAAGATLYESTEDEIASVQAGSTSGKQLWVTGTAMTLLTVDAKLMPILP